MTDRIKGFYVALREDMRDDDAEPIIAAVKQIRNVAAVQPILSDSNDWINREQVRQRFQSVLWELLKPGHPFWQGE